MRPISGGFGSEILVALYRRVGCWYAMRLRRTSIDTATARLGSRERDLDSSLIHRFLENRTLSIKTRKDTRRPVAPPTVTEIRLSACDLVLWSVRPTRIFDLYDKPRSAQLCFVTFWGSHFSHLTWAFVEVKGLEPSASTLRKCGSRCFDQGLSYDLPGSGVAIPSGPLTIPRLPAR